MNVAENIYMKFLLGKLIYREVDIKSKYICVSISLLYCITQGEYLAPEKIETVYSSCSLVQQIWIYGDSLQVINLWKQTG